MQVDIVQNLSTDLAQAFPQQIKEVTFKGILPIEDFLVYPTNTQGGVELSQNITNLYSALTDLIGGELDLNQNWNAVLERLNALKAALPPLPGTSVDDVEQQGGELAQQMGALDLENNAPIVQQGLVFEPSESDSETESMMDEAGYEVEALQPLEASETELGVTADEEKHIISAWHAARTFYEAQYLQYNNNLVGAIKQYKTAIRLIPNKEKYRATYARINLALGNTIAELLSWQNISVAKKHVFALTTSRQYMIAAEACDVKARPFEWMYALMALAICAVKIDQFKQSLLNSGNAPAVNPQQNAEYRMGEYLNFLKRQTQRIDVVNDATLTEYVDSIMKAVCGKEVNLEAVKTDSTERGAKIEDLKDRREFWKAIEAEAKSEDKEFEKFSDEIAFWETYDENSTHLIDKLKNQIEALESLKAEGEEKSEEIENLGKKIALEANLCQKSDACKIATLYIQVGQNLDAIFILMETIKGVTWASNPNLLSYSFALLGVCWLNLEDPEVALPYLKDAEYSFDADHSNDDYLKIKAKRELAEAKFAELQIQNWAQQT